MPTVSFTESDLLRNKVVDPAWYEVEIQEVGEWKPAKDQKSNNLEMQAVIVRNADNGDTKFAQVPVTIRFNDQVSARGFIEAFLRGLGVDVQAGTYELSSAKGRKLVVFVKNDTYEGRLNNKVDGYRAPTTNQPAVPTQPVTA